MERTGRNAWTIVVLLLATGGVVWLVHALRAEPTPFAVEAMRAALVERKVIVDSTEAPFAGDAAATIAADVQRALGAGSAMERKLGAGADTGIGAEMLAKASLLLGLAAKLPSLVADGTIAVRAKARRRPLEDFAGWTMAVTLPGGPVIVVVAGRELETSITVPRDVIPTDRWVRLVADVTQGTK